MATLDRLAVNQWHRLLFVKEDAHLRAAIDGRWVFDLHDDPRINTGPVLNWKSKEAKRPFYLGQGRCASLA